MFRSYAEQSKIIIELINLFLVPKTINSYPNLTACAYNGPIKPYKISSNLYLYLSTYVLRKQDELDLENYNIDQIPTRKLSKKSGKKTIMYLYISKCTLARSICKILSLVLN